MAKLSAQKKYQKLQEKKIQLTDKMEKLQTELEKTEEELEFAEFLAWKEKKKENRKVVIIDGVGADAESDKQIIAENLLNGVGEKVNSC